MCQNCGVKWRKFVSECPCNSGKEEYNMKMYRYVEVPTGYSSIWNHFLPME